MGLLKVVKYMLFYQIFGIEKYNLTTSYKHKKRKFIVQIKTSSQFPFFCGITYSEKWFYNENI